MASKTRPLLLASVTAAMMCGMLAYQSVLRLRTMAGEMVELRSALATAAAERDAALQRLELQGDIAMEGTLKLQAAYPPSPTPPPPALPPPPCPTTAAEGQTGPPAPAPGQAPVPVPGQAPAPVPDQARADWRVPPGPVPPRPPMMPRWFKFQRPERWCVPGPHNKVHSNRVAAIVVNYNMVERTDNIAEGIKKYVRWPVDVIVVDNGSDRVESPPSKHTAIRLEANVQTTNGWLMGVEYAKALSHAYGYCYMAYWIWITTSEYVETKDILTPMAEAMIADPQIVGVAPYLTEDSLPKTWLHLYKQQGTKDTDLKDVKFLDNLATLWRAEWFDSIGVFDPDELRGFGVDTENSYLARLSGRRIVVHQGVSIRKTSGVAYQMKRMNADKQQRNDVATKEMRNCLGFRYGDGKFEGGYTTWSNMPLDKNPPYNDFNQNPRAFFTNRRGTWFDDYTSYRPYKDVPRNVPLFQFPLSPGTMLKPAGTNGLAGHGLERRLLSAANQYRNSSGGTGESGPGDPGAVYVLRGDAADEYGDYYAWQRAVLAESNLTAFEEEYLTYHDDCSLPGPATAGAE